MERARTTVDGHVATVTLTRPERHNALDRPMIDAILATLAQLQDDHGVRVVVLHGEGPSFCSGMDFPSFMRDGVFDVDALLAIPDAADCSVAQCLAMGWAQLPVPVICVLQGAAFGGGLQVALAADVRIAAPDARLSLFEARWGLVPDMGVTHTLPRLVGHDVARELTYSGREVDGTEAHALGLVTRVADDPLAAAQAMAGEWAARSPDALRRGKRLWEQTGAMGRREALALEVELQRELFGTPNQLEALRAGLAHETPEYADPS